MVMEKIFGWVSIVFGLLLIILFPSVKNYMPDRFAHAGVLLGIFFVALGIYLIQA